MNTTMHRPSYFYRAALMLLAVVMVTACEDPIPDDYIEEIVIEGFVIAEQPLSKIKVYASQPLSDTFRIEDAMISDAQVSVLENGLPIPMMFTMDSLGGFYEAVDTAFRVKYDTRYDLTVDTRGFHITATAETKSKFDWVNPPDEVLYYPGKENETVIFDSLNISWTGQVGISRYIIAMECLDTLGYGEYLTPPTPDSNRRLRDNDFDNGTLVANERTIHGLSFVSNTPVVWRAFKWFGAHELNIYTGDQAFEKWFSQVGFGRRSSYDYRLSNIKGGLGIWAGAAKISAPLFLVKDNP